MKHTIWILEDEPVAAVEMRLALEDEFDVILCGTQSASVVREPGWAPTVALVDVEAPAEPQPGGGFPLLNELRQAGYRGKIIVMTSSRERWVAVEAVRDGAFDVVQKPLDQALVKQIVRRAAYLADLEREAQDHSIASSPEMNEVLGTSAGIRTVLDAIHRVAAQEAPVLITGEAGSGRTATARAIHARSARRQAPFVSVDCRDLSNEHGAKQLFGSETRSPAQSAAGASGAVAAARGGTLLLQDIDTLPPALQATLVGVLDGPGGAAGDRAHPHRTEFRLIATTTNPLQSAVDAGLVRRDLQARLAGTQIAVPPLRERGEDVPLLATACLRRAAERSGKHVQGFSREAWSALRRYQWPGNVQELSETIERAVMITQGTLIGTPELGLPSAATDEASSSISLKVNQQRIETDLILKAFTLSQGNLSRAAQELGISRSTLYRRLRQYGMDRTMDARRTVRATVPCAWPASNH